MSKFTAAVSFKHVTSVQMLMSGAASHHVTKLPGDDAHSGKRSCMYCVM
jgi:hypothetical protein